MLDSQDVFAAAEQAIRVVDDAREDVPIRGVKNHYYTLEGAVAEVLFRQLDMPFERALRRAVGRARDEETHLRLGNIDLRDLAGGDWDESKSGSTQAEKLERLLTDALAELRTLREHECQYDSHDLCTICGLDGRA